MDPIAGEAADQERATARDIATSEHLALDGEDLGVRVCDAHAPINGAGHRGRFRAAAYARLHAS